MVHTVVVLLAAAVVAVSLGDDAEDEVCALQVRENRSKVSDPGECTLCSSCGGDWPRSAGRATYYQKRTTEWHGFGEECSGQLRERTGDSSVIYSPDICCKSSGSLLIQGASSDTSMAEDTKDAAGSGPEGACAICESCEGGTYSLEAGLIPYIDTSAVNQNYEAFEGKCTPYKGTQSVNPSGSPPSGKLCCKPSSSDAPVGTCTLCGGSCGGSFPYDGGYLPYAKTQDAFETIKFTGWGSGCSSGFKTWHANSLSFLPKLCCNV